VLVALVTHRDRVVPKPELLDLVWPGLVVEENNLQVQVLTLRKLLGNGAIVTVSGRGYRLTLEATSSPRAAATGAEASAPASSALVRTDAAASATELIGRAALLAEVERSLASPTACQTEPIP
jgi:DNA-binding winged helix-turn-helix (wHTH) protein